MDSNTQCGYYRRILIHDAKYKILIIKPTRYTNSSNLFLEGKSTIFGQFLCPSSGVFHCTHSNGICHTGLLTACEQEHMLLLTSCQKTCMTYTIAVCTVKNSWWWTEELSEKCRVSFQEYFWVISASSWFYFEKFNAKYKFIYVLIFSINCFPN